jgi:hypothetical protein
MPLPGGFRLGPYEILAPIGAGGMGEVYKARDTRLDRAVAIKVLPEALALDPDLRERLDREARAISKLAHPHICTLFDVGSHDGHPFLVMELLDGESLDSRLTQGPLPVDQALTNGIAIAAALDAAHRAGIVHRDLKPGNVMLTKSGAKLLDFGLAKASAPVVAVSGLSMMPTTPPASITAAGTILGTFQYMAPEQIEGMDADARTDIFALGCVLFEMITGTKAFDGQTRASLLGSILKDDPPPISKVRPIAPSSLDRVVAACLAKNPDDRWQSARDLQRELQWVASGAGNAAPGASAVETGKERCALPILAAAVASAVIVGGAVWMLTRPAPNVAPAVHLEAPPNPGVSLWIDNVAPDVAISPDATHIAYTGGNGQLYVRSLGEDRSTPLEGTVNSRGPFFSPDGEWIGFFQITDLKKVAVRGGPPVVVCAGCAGGNRGAAWASDDTIIFAAQAGNSGLLRVSAGGGTPTPIAKPDAQKGESAYAWPHLLPGDRAVLFTVFAGALNDGTIAVRDLQTGTQKLLVRGGASSLYVRSGHLVYGAAGTLRAIRFDPATLTVSGSAIPVLEHVATKSAGSFDIGVSSRGVAAYITGDQSVLDVVSFDRHGNQERLNLPPRAYVSLRVSPDGQRIAADIRDQENDIWVWDISRRTLNRVTAGAFVEQTPVWTPDGRRIAFSSSRQGLTSIFWQAADGTGEAERLTASSRTQMPLCFTPDGQSLIFREIDPDSTFGVLFVLPLQGDRTPRPLMRTPANVSQAALSPDGHWLAYQSTESGQDEIYVRPFPQVESGHTQVSTDGGSRPVWAPTGHELFYLGSRFRLLSVALQPSPFVMGNPTPVFSFGLASVVGLSRFFDVTPDGHVLAVRSLAPKDAPEQPNQLRVILNWDEELKRLAPAKQ